MRSKQRLWNGIREDLKTEYLNHLNKHLLSIFLNIFEVTFNSFSVVTEAGKISSGSFSGLKIGAFTYLRAQKNDTNYKKRFDRRKEGNESHITEK